MKVFFETPRGKVFSIEVDSSDTVLVMKQKIETSLGIPLSKQTIFFKGKLLLQDHLTLQEWKIVNNSRLEFFSSRSYNPNHNINRVLHQTEQSSLPSSSNQEILNIQDSTEKITTNQDSNVMVRSNDDQVLHQTEESLLPSNSIEEMIRNKNQVFQTEQSPVPSNSMINTQDLPGSSNQTEQSSSVPSNSYGDFMFGEDQPLTTEAFSNIQSFWPVTTTEEMINSNQVFQMEPSPPSNSTEQRINDDQDLPGRVGSSNQVVQTEKSPPSNSIKEVINIPDSPVRSSNKPPQMLRVMMLPYSRESKPVRKFPMEVNASEKVEELRKELEKIQQLNLPEEGYIFIHKQRVMEDNQSFHWNGVAHGDTIEIFPGSY